MFCNRCMHDRSLLRFWSNGQLIQTPRLSQYMLEPLEDGAELCFHGDGSPSLQHEATAPNCILSSVACFRLPLSVSLSLTHSLNLSLSHTHTHSFSLSICLPVSTLFVSHCILPLFFSLSLCSLSLSLSFLCLGLPFPPSLLS